MNAASRRIVSTISLGSFMVAATTGLVFSVPPGAILLRSLAVGAALGALSAVVAWVFERIWTK